MGNPQQNGMATTEKICGVCGDAARCNHFGRLCCASCKVFFRRSVVKDEYKEYRCVGDGACVISVVTRRRCSHCRLKRCLAIGMNKRYCMSEPERQELRRNTQLQRAGLLLPRHFRPEQDPWLYINCHQVEEINGLSKCFLEAYQSAKPLWTMGGSSRAPKALDTALEYGQAIKRLLNFVQKVPKVMELEETLRIDQIRSRTCELMIVYGCVSFDPLRQTYSHGENTLLKGYIYHPTPVNENVHTGPNEMVALYGEKGHMHFQWMTQVLKLGINKDVVLLLCMLVLFRPDAPSPVLEKTFAHFMHLLKMYLRVKMGASVCQAVFVQLMMSLQDLARLKRFNETRKLRLAASEVQEVSKKLGGLTLPVDCSNAAVPTAQPAISTSEGLPVNKKQSHVLWTDLLELKIGIILLQFHPDLLRSRSLRQVPAEEL